MASLVSVREQHHHTSRDGDIERVERAFARLQTAWRSVRAQSPGKGSSHFDAAAMGELDAAEEEWLAARAAADLNC